MRDNLNYSEKENLKKEDNKREKAKRDNLDDNVKVQLRKYQREGNQVMLDNLHDQKYNI